MPSSAANKVDRIGAVEDIRVRSFPQDNDFRISEIRTPAMTYGARFRSVWYDPKKTS
jgi:hypothetical protein